MEEEKRIERLNRILQYNLEVYQRSLGELRTVIDEKNGIIRTMEQELAREGTGRQTASSGRDKEVSALEQRIRKLEALLWDRDEEIESLKNSGKTSDLPRIKELKKALEEKQEEIRARDRLLERLKETITDQVVELEIKDQENKKLRSRVART